MTFEVPERSCDVLMTLTESMVVVKEKFRVYDSVCEKLRLLKEIKSITDEEEPTIKSKEMSTRNQRPRE